jgi:CheY-like chemotaxis protein
VSGTRRKTVAFRAAPEQGVSGMRYGLVVDDDASVCAIICEALGAAGWSVEHVSTDGEAHARIPRLPTLDALVLDVNLGHGTTGFDVARFARQVIPGVAVLYISGAVSENSFKTFGVPGSRFLAKPFTPDELADALSRLQRSEA